MTADETLLAAVGTPPSIHDVDIAGLPCVVAWLAEPVTTRAEVVGELARALDALRQKPVWEEMRCVVAWGASYDFTTMIALSKAIDRLIRAKLPLSETTLTLLAQIVLDRTDFSELRLTAQLEHFAKTQPVSPTLREAMLVMSQEFSWNPKLVARIAWIAAEAQPARVKAANSQRPK